MHSSICHVTTNAVRQGHLHPPHTLHARPALTSEEHQTDEVCALSSLDVASVDGREATAPAG